MDGMLTEITLPLRRSRRGEPTWELLDRYPVQGEWTAEEFLGLPNNKGLEFIDGRLEAVPVPDALHQMLVKLLVVMLDALVLNGEHGRALQAGMKLRTRKRRWREPDVVYLAPHNLHQYRNEYWTYADLAIEVVSQDDPKRDYVKKRREYAKRGVPEYWIVDPKFKAIFVLVLDGDVYREQGRFVEGETATSATLAGFSVDVAKLFRDAGPPPQARRARKKQP